MTIAQFLSLWVPACMAVGWISGRRTKMGPWFWCMWGFNIGMSMPCVAWLYWAIWS